MGSVIRKKVDTGLARSRAATDFENKADYIRDEVTKLCDQYPLYQ